MGDKLPGAWVGAVRLRGWPSASCLNPRTACKLWKGPLPLTLVYASLSSSCLVLLLLGGLSGRKSTCRVQDTGLGSKQGNGGCYCAAASCVGGTLTASSKRQCLRGFTECFQQRAGPHLFYSNSPAWPKVSSNKDQMDEYEWMDVDGWVDE